MSHAGAKLYARLAALLILLLAVSPAPADGGESGERPPREQESQPTPSPEAPVAHDPQAVPRPPENLAADVLGPRHRKQDTEHFHVYADSDSSTVRDTARILELTHDRFFAEFSESYRLAPQAERMTALVFSSQESFQRFARTLSIPNVAKSGGLYVRHLGTLFVFDADESTLAEQVARARDKRQITAKQARFILQREFRQNVVHEATHQLQQQAGLLPSCPPLWLVEGMAEDFGGSLSFNGRSLVPGQSDPISLGLFREAAAAKRLLPLTDIVSWNGSISLLQRNFSGDEGRLIYAQFWALHHYFAFEQGDAGREKLRRFIEAIHQLPMPDPTVRLSASSPAELEERKREWLQRFQEQVRRLEPRFLALFRECFGEDLEALQEEIVRHYGPPPPERRRR